MTFKYIYVYQLCETNLSIIYAQSRKISVSVMSPSKPQKSTSLQVEPYGALRLEPSAGPLGMFGGTGSMMVPSLLMTFL